MRTVSLGASGLEVTPIAFGTWQIGGDWGDFDEAAAIDAIQTARALGITLFDTAQAYGFGVSERLLGRALRDDLDHRRDEVVIATKGGLRMTDDGPVRDSSRAWLRAGVAASLEALGIDHIDLYQVHWPDPATPFAETAAALQELVDEGTIRHVGVSNYASRQMAEFARTRPVETLQPPYHLFRREIEDEVLPYAQEHDIGVLAYGPLAHGLLSGAMSTQTVFDEDDWRATSPVFHGETFARNLAAVERLKGLASEMGLTVGQLSIAWVLAHPAVDVAIVGARSSAHIAEAVHAADVGGGPELRARVEEVVGEVVPVGGPTPESVLGDE
jgi:aryl-alcohol dehydrogenase-like predicted oxidoreductase